MMESRRPSPRWPLVLLEAKLDKKTFGLFIIRDSPKNLANDLEYPQNSTFTNDEANSDQNYRNGASYDQRPVPPRHQTISTCDSAMQPG
jgi:hypothetical protein